MYFFFTGIVIFDFENFESGGRRHAPRKLGDGEKDGMGRLEGMWGPGVCVVAGCAHQESWFGRLDVLVLMYPS